MKCPGCGKEINCEKQKFCIYCGESLKASKRPAAPRTPSRVLRMQRRNDLSSQASLPEVQQNQLPKMNLASLSSSHAAVRKNREDDTDMAKNKDLADLLLKLDGNSETLPKVNRQVRDGGVQKERTDDDNISLGSLSEESLGLSGPHRSSARPISSNRSRTMLRPAAKEVSPIADEDDLELSLEVEDVDAVSADNSMQSLPSLSLNGEFFDPDDEEAADDSGESASIPTASGSFARTPSGGFRLALESIRTSCSNLVNRVKSRFQGKDKVRSTGNRRSETVTMAKADKRRKAIALALVSLGLIALLVFVFSTGSNNEDKQSRDTTNSIATNESNSFELIALEGDSATEDVPTFDAGAFDADAFEFGDEEDSAMPAAAAARPSAVPADSAAQAAAVAAAQAEAAKLSATKDNKAPAQAAAPAAAKQNAPKELRKYGRTDNLVISATPETVKLTRSCVMREGPASRFPLVAEIKPGQKVDILTTTDEDWLFSNGVWTKTGQADRLGPGTQFAEAKKGMTVAAPSSRVISAKNWKYVKAGKNYGYVGPACFKK